MPTQHVRAAAMVAAIARDSDLAPYAFGSFSFNSNGLSLVEGGKPSFEEWEAVGTMLATQIRGLQFMVGDWLNIGEQYFGELAAQAIDSRQWAEETVVNYRWVAKSIPTENRMLDRGLTFKHHQLVARMPPPEQARWLRRALGDDGERWTTAELQAAIKAPDGELPAVSGWYLIVDCPSAERRSDVQRELEAKGLRCKVSERRGPR